MQLNQKDIQSFQAFIWNFYNTHGRDFSWRNTTSVYHVVVSEIMLQQTQTDRVRSKFEQFLDAFPTFEELAQAPLRDLLFVWQGLGYNRRALALQKIAQAVVSTYHGVLPNNLDELQKLPGIGPATAASICAFAFNIPTVFIETNIRTVFIHTFFNKKIDVADAELMPLIEQTCDQDNPREWYYALMDYGVFLKKQMPNPSRKSKHHTKQSPFQGSDRQIRGAIIRLLTRHDTLDITALPAMLQRDAQRIERIVGQLVRERFIQQKKTYITLV